VNRSSYCFCRHINSDTCVCVCVCVCALLFIFLGWREMNYVTRQINFPNVGAVLMLYTPRDERHWKIFIVIPSGIHSHRHFLFFFFFFFAFSIYVHSYQVSYVFLALFLFISLQDMFLYPGYNESRISGVSHCPFC
jgi:hypothetical protein